MSRVSIKKAVSTRETASFRRKHASRAHPDDRRDSPQTMMKYGVSSRLPAPAGAAREERTRANEAANSALIWVAERGLMGGYFWTGVVRQQLGDVGANL